MVANLKISIIIPVYNVENYIRECISSVLNQTYKNIEVILVNDGSTDNSGNICDEYVWNKKIKVVHKKNGGLSDARNKGLEYASGDYIIFLDSDDYWNDIYFLKKIVKILSKNRPDLVVFGYKKFNCSGVTKKYLPRHKEKDICSLAQKGEFNICAWDKIIKHSLLTQNNILFRKNVFSEDMEWCAKIFLAATTCDVLNEFPYSYRQRKGSITNHITKKNIDDVIDNYNRCLDIQKLMYADKRKAFNYYLSKNFSMFIIAFSQIKIEKRIYYFDFIKKNMEILQYSVRKREYIIYYGMKLLGIPVMLMGLRCYYFIKRIK